jgi:predicted phage terminase large subunit-like protein
MPATTNQPLTSNPFEVLIEQLGEEGAKAYLRDFYADPENLPAFAMLFDKHVPSYPPEFHIEMWRTYTTTEGNVGGCAPRGFAKSTSTSLVYLAFRTLNATSRFSIVISDTYTQAVDLLAGLKDELAENEMIRWLYGDVVGESWAEDDIEVLGYDPAGRRVPCRIIALGAGMKVRGRKFKNFRPQLIIIDDLENDEAVQSKERRAKLRKWLVRAVLPAIDRTIGRVIMIGTILHKRSLLNAIVNKEAEFRSWHTFKLAGIMDGKSIWPELYSTKEIYQWRDDPSHPNYLGAVAWAQEIQNNPQDEGLQIIQDEWLEGQGFNLAELINRWVPLLTPLGQELPEDYDILGEWLKFHFKAIHTSVDPAISEKQTADFWAMVTVGITKQCPLCNGAEGHIMILDYVRMREPDPNKQVQTVIDNYLLWQHDKVRVEAVAYQSGLVRLIKNEAAKQGLYLPIRPFRPTTSKVARMNIHAANFSGRLVHYRADHPLAPAFIEELTEFPQGEHDDMVDSYMGAADVSLKRRGRTGTQDE